MLYSVTVLHHGEYEWQDPKSPDEMYANVFIRNMNVQGCLNIKQLRFIIQDLLCFIIAV